MPTTTFNYGDWSFWRPYFPPDGYYGESKIAFDGPNRLILIAEGETLISVKSQIYSVWKRWVQVPGANNARWPQAISAVGGDPITTTLSQVDSNLVETQYSIIVDDRFIKLVVPGTTISTGGALTAP
ncbi:MAG: hypothetical protein VW518_11830, partial [Burkholderiaceae bacterium]